MKKYFHVPTRYLACFMALSMVCTSAPATVSAQEDVLAGETVSGDEAQSSRTLVITKFTVKNEEKYENLTAPQGTELNQLGLPDVITVEGYLESDGADVPQEAADLEKMVWKLDTDPDTDNDETYSPETPAGTYKFTPDFKKYAKAQIEAGTALYEEFKLADDVKPLTIEVVIEEPATEPAQTEPLETELMATEAVETEPTATEPMAAEPAQTEPMATEPAQTEPMATEPAQTEPMATEPAQTEPMATEPPASEEDIFSGMDDSLIGADGSDVWFSDQPESETAVPAQEPEQLIGYGTGTIEETSPDPSESPAPADQPSSETQSEQPTELQTEPPAAPEVSVIITLTDGTHSASFPADTNVSAPYKLAGNPTADGSAATNPTLLLENLPCGMDLSKVTVTVKAADDSVALTVNQASVDFAAASTQNLILTSGGAVSYTYPLSLTVSKADHAWADATCTAPKTCTVCGATEGEKLPHTWKEATCTTPKTCTVCGATEGEKLGHNWKKATCTEPQTCKRCGKTKGEKLGHNWLEATCTEPKTCKRCNATKGKALGHDLRDDWQTVEKSTDTKHGLEERLCHRKGCDYTEERDLNIIGAPENNGISGVTANANYELNAIISFTASGSGMSNSEPIDGDVRYVPLSWSVQGTPGSFRDNYAGGFSVTQAGTYTLSVTYQKQSYQGSWQSTNETDSKSVSFTVGSASADPSATPTDGGIHINPQTGDNTPIVGLVVTLIAAVSLIAAMLVYKKKRQNHRA